MDCVNIFSSIAFESNSRLRCIESGAFPSAEANFCFMFDPSRDIPTWDSSFRCLNDSVLDLSVFEEESVFGQRAGAWGSLMKFKICQICAIYWSPHWMDLSSRWNRMAGGKSRPGEFFRILPHVLMDIDYEGEGVCADCTRASVCDHPNPTADDRSSLSPTSWRERASKSWRALIQRKFKHWSRGSKQQRTQRNGNNHSHYKSRIRS
jgi:hypothetical protein